ncbi:MAG: cupredoxin domain-containing protein [Proteobacteria bacterium]|nr:cupredoxin domain-containing protein [Pseudomonadota bacterium]
MTAAQIIVTLAGLSVSVLIVWFFFFSAKKGVRVETKGNIQEATIRVKGGYTPDVIVVERGKPVRLNFHREETAACSEMVLIPDFNKSAKLPTGQTVPIEFLPEKPGEYEFSCQMGMFRGKLVVE